MNESFKRNLESDAGKAFLEKMYPLYQMAVKGEISGNHLVLLMKTVLNPTHHDYQHSSVFLASAMGRKNDLEFEGQLTGVMESLSGLLDLELKNTRATYAIPLTQMVIDTLKAREQKPDK